jgi:hypothetical protein
VRWLNSPLAGFYDAGWGRVPQTTCLVVLDDEFMKKTKKLLSFVETKIMKKTKKLLSFVETKLLCVSCKHVVSLWNQQKKSDFILYPLEYE